jgi:hypothetical protein
LVKPVLRNLAILLLVFAPAFAMAQDRDSLLRRQDTVKNVLKAEPAKPPVAKSAARLELEKMPRRAAIRSAIIPGWGQITNRRWWKVPLVYGGFVTLAFVYDYNQTNYKIFLTEAQNREYNQQNPALPPRYVNPGYRTLTSSGIIKLKDAYRRDRDLTILGGLAFYTITIIDAYVDAKFFRFDIDDELALQVKPAFQQVPGIYTSASPVASVKVSLSLTK